VAVSPVSPPDFRPGPPGWIVVFNYGGEISQLPLQGWTLTTKGWLPTYWETDALHWIDPDDPIGKDLDLREVRVEPAAGVEHADSDALEDHAKALRGLTDAIGRHNAALADHADALGRYR
jgi:hypothetical protein